MTLLDVTFNTIKSWSRAGEGAYRFLPIQTTEDANGRPRLYILRADLVEFLARPENEKYAERADRFLAHQKAERIREDYRSTFRVVQEYLTATPNQ